MIIWVPMFWIAAGVCLFAGAHFMHAGRSREDEQLYLSFGVLSLAVAVYMVITALMQDPNLDLSAGQLERLHLSAACVIYPTAVWFLALFSRLQRWKATFAVVSLVFGILLLINLTSRQSLLYHHIHDLEPLTLWWGEHIRQLGGRTAPLALVYYACTFAVFAWAFWRCHALWRQGDWRRARPLLFYLLLQLLAVASTEYTTYMNIPALEWDSLPFLGLILLLSRSLTLELRGYAQDLQRSNLALVEENAARTRAQTRLEHAAYHDALTGLPNRRALREHLDGAKAISPGSHGALIIIDPERFRIINQALGHHVGDQLMREISRRLRGDGLSPRQVTRLDGDEFAVLLEDLPSSLAEAEALALETAERIRDELTANIRLDSHDLSADVSAGVALITPDGQDSDSVLREAYMALQEARKNSRERVMVFAQDMKRRAERNLRLENDLRLAIEQDALDLVYQPQTDLRERMVGAEALLRWRHPELEAIHPEEFIRIAEDSGLIQPLGSLVLRNACRALRQLGVRDGRFRMSVNISPWQLFLTDFPDSVDAILRQSGIAPDQLTLEITESVFMHDVDDAIAKIHALNARGIRVAIDDFGTGYASIALLKDLPVDEVKIDQAFIRNMNTEQPDRFMAAMIALGRALDLTVVAEGVESQVQRDCLAAMGCDVFQGFHISRPVDLDDLQGRLGRATAQA